MVLEDIEIPRVMLHARTLGFTHPTSATREEFTRPFPPDMERVIHAFEHLIAPKDQTPAGARTIGTANEELC
jgi:23S rRNA pseudouridine1911/1915/1917 synthase